MSETESRGDNRRTSEVVQVDPEMVGIDSMNERTENIETDDLEDSVAEMGVIQPPLVRPNSDGETYTAVVGQRRVLAAINVGLDEIPVVVVDWDDEEALKASITENIDLFSQDVPMSDRAEALQQLWELMGNSGVPTYSHLGKELGVPRKTIQTWLEPLHGDWDETSIDPDSPEEMDPDVDSLGEKKLAEIRRMTGGGEEGEQVAEMVAEAGLTQSQLKSMRKLVDEGVAYEDAIDRVQDDGGPSEIEAKVSFDSHTSQAVHEYAEENDEEPAIVIMEAVEWFLESEGYLDD